MTELLRVGDLHVRPTVEPGAPAADAILRGLDLTVAEGEVHAIVGPNGSGTSSLGATLLGSPEYEVTAGSVEFRGDHVTDWPTDERAKAGMFLAFRHPHEIPGVSLIAFLGQALSARKGIDRSVPELRQTMIDWLSRLGIDPSLVDRRLDEGFTRDEQHGSEILQMAMLEPELAILDATDASLDALGILATGIHEVRSERPTMGVVLLASDQRRLDEIEPDHVHILLDGRIVASGGVELADELGRNGHHAFRATA